MSENETQNAIVPKQDEQALVEDLRRQLATANADLAKVRSENVALRTDVANARGEARRLEESNRGLTFENAELRASLTRWRIGGAIAGIAHLFRG